MDIKSEKDIFEKRKLKFKELGNSFSEKEDVRKAEKREVNTLLKVIEYHRLMEGHRPKTFCTREQKRKEKNNY